MKGSDVSSIHESLFATCGDENASLSLYQAGYMTEGAGCAACQPLGYCIFSLDKSLNLFLHVRHNKAGCGGAIKVRNSDPVTKATKVLF